jgi:hypothetical protein
MKKKTKHELRDFMLNEMKEYGYQSSWDWAADLRFAEFIGDETAVEMLHEIMKSNTVWPIIIAVHEQCIGKVKRKRLSILRELVSMGEADSWWTGTGHGGGHDFGAKRVRTYGLRECS